ncbi:MAG: NAD(P)H-dependent glycerol-3-phosphate dehydrogenase [Parvicellaceae bacterium]
MNKKSVAVIGGGSWGTAIVSILSSNIDLMWWVRREKQKNQIISKKRNPRYLPNCKLNTERINITSNIEDTINNAHLIIIATPSEFLLDIFEPYKKELKNKIIISAVKGVISPFNQTPNEFFHGLNNNIDYGVISGPCHAEEVALNKISYLTLSVNNEATGKFLSSIFTTEYIKIKLSNDVVGTELSAILKNVYALITGICFGLGYGDNFLAVLITACTNEMKRVLYVLDHKERSISQSAYLGDLLVTCYSLHSRNRRFGNFIGKGYSVEATKSAMNMVAEGYNATNCIHELLTKESYNSESPIITATYNILYKEADPKEEIEALSSLIS